jgi:hypothetical protein
VSEGEEKRGIADEVVVCWNYLQLGGSKTEVATVVAPEAASEMAHEMTPEVVPVA